MTWTDESDWTDNKLPLRQLLPMHVHVLTGMKEKELTDVTDLTGKQHAKTDMNDTTNTPLNENMQGKTRSTWP